MRILALDPGTVRLGVAVSLGDPPVATTRPGLAAQPFGEAIASLMALVREEGIARVVVGRPLRLDGTSGVAERRALRWVRALREAGVEVVSWDERLTTVEATRSLQAQGVRARQQRDKVDSVAACLLLQSYLRSLEVG